MMIKYKHVISFLLFFIVYIALFFIKHRHAIETHENSTIEIKKMSIDHYQYPSCSDHPKANNPSFISFCPASHLHFLSLSPSLFFFSHTRRENCKDLKPISPLLIERKRKCE